jgi:hypothetical protein
MAREILRPPCSVVLCASSCQVTIVVQDEQLGLGHAVLCAGPHGSQFSAPPGPPGRHVPPPPPPSPPPPPLLGWLALASHRCSRTPAVCRFWIPAFFETRRHMTGDPMLLMLGDHIYRSTHEQGTSCVRQHVWQSSFGILGRAASSCGHAPRVAMLAFPIAAWPVVSVLPVCLSTQVQQLLSSYDGGSIMAPTHVHMVKRGLVAVAPQPAIWLTSM